MTNPLNLTLCAAALLTAQAQAQSVRPADLSYDGPNIRTLSAESYRLAGLSGDFGSWLAQAYEKGGIPLAGAKTLNEALSKRRAQLGSATPDEKDALARDTATWAHRFIKKVVPKFSLERGFEFASIVRMGERQCLLQSTVIAGLLQKAGLDAGLVMVWKSMSGAESNLGHVTSVLRLPSGAGDVQVDASEPQPFATHTGLLAWVDGGFRFVTAQFAQGSLITSYTRQDGKGRAGVNQLSFLPLEYVRSQYDYYRGERAIGGVLGTGTGKSTPAGLKASENFLQKALHEEPTNALAASVLGTVYRKEGHNAQAGAQYRKAAALYAAQGHLPASLSSNLSWAREQAK